MRTPPVKFYPPSDTVQRLDKMAVRLKMKRSHLMSAVLDAFVAQDYARLALLHDLEKLEKSLL